VRVVNGVDLKTLQPKEEHPHGVSGRDFDEVFMRDKPIIFGYSGYSWLIHRLALRGTNQNISSWWLHEGGQPMPPLDVVVQRDLDRLPLAMRYACEVCKAAQRSRFRTDAAGALCG